MALITITKTMGCGAGAIGHHVAEKLGFELFNDERFRGEALKLGLSEEDISRFDGKRPGFFDRLRSNKPERFRELMESLVYQVANHGNAVIVGHASQVLLHDFECAFHVFCSCSEASRVKRIAAKTGINEEDAKKIIRKADLAQDHFMRTIYSLDWREPTLYDLVVNTDKLGGDYAAQLIVTMVRERITDCGLDSLAAMARLSQQKKARAALLEAGVNLNLIFLEVIEEGKIYVHGLASTVEEAEDIKTVLEGVEGIREVVSEISVY